MGFLCHDQKLWDFFLFFSILEILKFFFKLFFLTNNIIFFFKKKNLNQNDWSK